MVRLINRVVEVGAIIAAAFVTGIVLLAAGPRLEAWINPVSVAFNVTSMARGDTDLMIQGTMIKRRDGCDYIQPPRARALHTNRNLLVVSLSPTAQVSWPADGEPQPFGPWIVKAAGDEPVEFYVVHKCHALWSIYTYLGEVK